MIGIDILITQISGLDRGDLERWIGNGWVRTEGTADAYQFQAIDVARAQLIFELHNDLSINEEALPEVLHLLDQLYSVRRQIDDLGDALDRLATREFRQALARQVQHSRAEHEAG